MTNQSIDVAIVGGGMVGAAAALGLANQGFHIAVIERNPLTEYKLTDKPDIRISAISHTSVNLLEKLGVWESVKALRSHPYHHLETWEWETAHLCFDAKTLDLPELGFMVENSVLQHVLWQALESNNNIVLFPSTVLLGIERHEEGWWLKSAEHPNLCAKMIIGADGANSQIRQWAGIGINAWQYRQSCMLITVECENFPGNSTWQHFTPTGPHAFLPLFDKWASLAWYDSPKNIKKLQALSLDQLKNEIQKNFPARLGEITPVERGSFPLIRRHAFDYVRPNLALIGDAAHTIHPLAGQGVNLGYRDVSALLDIMGCARSSNEDWSSLDVLKCYEKQRKADNTMMQIGMDIFYAGFSNEILPIKIMRNIGLMAAQRSGVLKQQALKYALGL